MDNKFRKKLFITNRTGKKWFSCVGANTTFLTLKKPLVTHRPRTKWLTSVSANMLFQLFGKPLVTHWACLIFVTLPKALTRLYYLLFNVTLFLSSLFNQTLSLRLSVFYFIWSLTFKLIEKNLYHIEISPKQISLYKR